MATILQFRRPKGLEPRVDKTLDRPLGDIVIFPGVRIERWAKRNPPINRHSPDELWNGANDSRRRGC
jgi:hypothetical protein